MPTRDQVLEALKAVIDPELHKDIVELDMVRSIEVHDNGVVDVMVSLTTAGCPIRNSFETNVTQAVSALEGVVGVNVAFDVLTDEEKRKLQQKLGRGGGLPDGSLALVKNVICVGSGKGGVGKSSVDREPRRRAGRARASRSASSTPTSGATRSRACSASAPSARPSPPSARSSRRSPTASR